MQLKNHKHQTWSIALVVVMSVFFLAACQGQATPAMPTADKVEAKPTNTEVVAAPATDTPEVAATPTEAEMEPTATKAEPSAEPTETSAPLEPVGDVAFAADVLPILTDRCTRCHGSTKAEKDLRLNTYENILLGGEKGPAVVAGDPDGSLIIQMIEAGKMPKRGEKVTAQELAILRAWILAGALDN